jgi:hypothetical protein
MANIEQVDGYDQFETIVTKWKNVSKIIMKWVAPSTSRMIQHAKTNGVPSLVISIRFTISCCAWGITKIIRKWEFRKELLPIFFETLDKGCMT